MYTGVSVSIIFSRKEKSYEINKVSVAKKKKKKKKKNLPIRLLMAQPNKTSSAV
jgi:hypothetical protein